VNDQTLPGSPALPLSVVKDLEKVLDRFEDAWKAAGANTERPRIEDYLGAAAEAERSVLLTELVHIDVYNRRLRGEDPQPAEYRTRFPDLKPDQLTDALASHAPGEPDRGLTGRRVDPSAIPGYEIMGILGHGGMGVIFEAWQVGLKRRVALKMIRDQAMANAQQLTRFATEAEAVARLQHPHIVQIYDIGENDGRPFFSLELMTGGNLAQKLAGAPLPAAQAAQLVETLARAVHYAHQRGILHRDLKPANVLLTAEGLPKIADFGLAKLTVGGAGETQSGTVLGTPSYIAPEQARGQIKDLGPAVDVYSLGAILYETLTGRPPFRAETPLETLRQVQADEPVSVVRLQPKVPRDLNTICLKCLQKEPRKRYPSAEALAEDLQRFIAAEPIRARPATAWERGIKWARRRPTAAALVAVSVVALLGLLGGMLWHNAQLDAANVELRAAYRTSEDRRTKADSNLYHSLVREAEAIRRARESGYRVKVFDRLKQALRLETPDKDPLQLRQEAAACLGDFVGVEPTTWEDFPALISSKSLHPDGTLLAVGLVDGMVLLYGIPAGAQIASLTGHRSVVTTLNFRTDGKELVSTDETGKIKIWQPNNTGTWTCRKTYTVEPLLVSLMPSLAFPFFTVSFGPRPIHSAALTPDGRHLAVSCAADSTLVLVDLADGTTAARFLAPEGEKIRHLALSPDGKLLAGTYTHNNAFGVLVWDVGTRALVKRLSPGLEWNFGVGFSPDAKLLAYVSLQGVALYDTSAFQSRLFAHGDRASSVAFSPDSQLVAIHLWHLGLIRLWNISMSRVVATLSWPASSAATGIAIDYGKDGKTLVAVTNRSVRIWNLAGASEKRVLEGHTGGVAYVSFSPDGKLLASASHDHKIRIWDPVTGTLIKTLAEFSSPVQTLSFTPDGRIMAAADYVPAGGDHRKGTVRFYDVESWKVLDELQPQVSPEIWSIAFSPKGQYFAVGGSNGLKVWRVAPNGARQSSGKRLPFQRLGPLTEGHFSSIGFSPDGNWLVGAEGASMEAPHSIHLWDLDNWQSHTLSTARCRYGIQALSFYPDSKHLAFVSAKPAIAVWDVTTKQETFSFGEGVLEQRGALPPHARLSADGAWYAVGGRAVTVWDMAAQKFLVALPEERSAVFSVSWSPNRELLAVGTSDGGLVIWNLPEVKARLAEISLGW
jgi:WD40 repeat protein